MTLLNLVEEKVLNMSLGECVLWDEIRSKIWWVDIEGQALYCSELFTGKPIIYHLPERLCSFALIKESDCILCAFETGLAIYATQTNEIEWIKKTREANIGIRMNDGRTDRFGRFWVGEMVEKENINIEEMETNLFLIDKNGTLNIQERGMGISNGLCWSPDGQNMYFCDSSRNEIYVYDLHKKTKNYVNKRLFVKTEKDISPDGSCIDSEGFLWNAQWGGGRVVRYDVNGKTDFILNLPSLRPTSVAFAGENLDYLVVTTAKLDNCSSKDRGGNVFIYKTPYKGILENRFVIDDTKFFRKFTNQY